MIAKHIGTAALAALLLAGTSALALAQSSTPQHQPSSADIQKGPASPNGGMSSGAHNGNESPTAPGNSAGGKNDTGAQQQGAQKSSSDKTGQNSSQPSSQKSSQSTSQPSGKNAQTGGAQGSTSGSAPAGASANITSKQKTVIKNKIIDNKSAPRVSHVDFNVSVGVAVPTSIHLAPLPPAIVEFHPAWRSYVYFVYEEEVIIVDPHTHKIIEIITVS